MIEKTTDNLLVLYIQYISLHCIVKWLKV